MAMIPRSIQGGLGTQVSVLSTGVLGSLSSVVTSNPLPSTDSIAVPIDGAQMTTPNSNSSETWLPQWLFDKFQNFFESGNDLASVENQRNIISHPVNKPLVSESSFLERGGRAISENFDKTLNDRTRFILLNSKYENDLKSALGDYLEKFRVILENKEGVSNDVLKLLLGRTKDEYNRAALTMKSESGSPRGSSNYAEGLNNYLIKNWNDIIINTDVDTMIAKPTTSTTTTSTTKTTTTTTTTSKTTTEKPTTEKPTTEQESSTKSDSVTPTPPAPTRTEDPTAKPTRTEDPTAKPTTTEDPTAKPTATTTEHEPDPTATTPPPEDAEKPTTTTPLPDDAEKPTTTTTTDATTTAITNAEEIEKKSTAAAQSTAAAKSTAAATAQTTPASTDAEKTAATTTTDATTLRLNSKEELMAACEENGFSLHNISKSQDATGATVYSMNSNHSSYNLSQREDGKYDYDFGDGDRGLVSIDTDSDGNQCVSLSSSEGTNGSPVVAIVASVAVVGVILVALAVLRHRSKAKPTVHQNRRTRRSRGAIAGNTNVLGFNNNQAILSLYGNVGYVKFPVESINSMTYNFESNSWFIEVEDEIDSGVHYHHMKNVKSIETPDGVIALDGSFDPKTISEECGVELGTIIDTWTGTVDSKEQTNAATKKLYSSLSGAGRMPVSLSTALSTFKKSMPTIPDLTKDFDAKQLSDFEQLSKKDQNFFTHQNMTKVNRDLIKKQFKVFKNTACPIDSLAFALELGLMVVKHKGSVYQCSAPKPNPSIGDITDDGKTAAVAAMSSTFNSVANAHGASYVRCVSCSEEVGSSSHDYNKNKFTPFYEPAPGTLTFGSDLVTIGSSGIGIEGDTIFSRVKYSESSFTVDFRYWLSDGKGVFHAHVVNWVDLEAITPSELAFLNTEYSNFVEAVCSDLDVKPNFDEIPLITHCTAGVGRSGVVAVALGLLDRSTLDKIATDLKSNAIDGPTAFAQMRTYLDTIITDGRIARNVEGYVDTDQTDPDTRAMFVQTKDQYALLLAYCMEYVASMTSTEV